jgi:hypothetical protein
MEVMKIKTYTKIEKKLFEVGFDEFYQAGTKNQYRPLNIIAKSEILNKQFWVTVDSVYRSYDIFHIIYRDLNNTKAKQYKIECKNQTDVVEKLNNIQFDIITAKGLIK